MKKYSTVEVKCFKDSKFCHYEEHYQNITPDQLEQELNQLIGAGWTKFQVIIDGNKQSKVLIDKNPGQQGKSVLSEKSPIRIHQR